MNPFPSFNASGSVERGDDRWVEFSGMRGQSQYLGRPLSTRQFTVALFVVFLTLGVLFVSAARLQVVHGEAYRALADGNRIRSYAVLAPRGLLYDRFGQALTENVPRISLAFIPYDVPRDAAARDRLFADVAGASSVTADELHEAWDALSSGRRERLEPVVLHRDLDLEKSVELEIKARHWPGIAVLTTPRRSYPGIVSFGESLSHVLGYVGRVGDKELQESAGRYAAADVIGRNGLELVYEQVLKGTNGRRDIEVDALGNELQVYASVEPSSGSNIWLTIDAALQQATEGALRRGLERAGETRGVAVVLNPQNGELLSLVSLPSFDANAFTLGLSVDTYGKLATDPDQPLFNRATQGRYPSGSTIKPIVAAAALEEGLISARTTFLSSGGLRVSSWFFPDWKAGGHGLTNVRLALAESVNTFFYIIGGGFGDVAGLGIDRLAEYLRHFGLGVATGIDLPGEASGLVPTPEWKRTAKDERWYIGDTYHVAIGQGDVLVTPLQIATTTSIFANGGRAIQPHLVLDSAPGAELNLPPASAGEQLANPETVAVVRQGLRDAVTVGSARGLAGLPITAAGKTGTAELGGTRQPHAWFTGFAPFEDPEIVVTVLLEESGEGSSNAVPVAAEIMRWWAVQRFDERE